MKKAPILTSEKINKFKEVTSLLSPQSFRWNIKKLLRAQVDACHEHYEAEVKALIPSEEAVKTVLEHYNLRNGRCRGYINSTNVDKIAQAILDLFEPEPEKCSECGGSGHLPMISYLGRECPKCHGTGIKLVADPRY